MFFDPAAWPPAPDGFDPQPEPPRRLEPAQERTLLRMVGVLLLVLFLGPFAGSSVIEAVVALVRWIASA